MIEIRALKNLTGPDVRKRSPRVRAKPRQHAVDPGLHMYHDELDRGAEWVFKPESAVDPSFRTASAMDPPRGRVHGGIDQRGFLEPGFFMQIAPRFAIIRSPMKHPG
jgi:hypothetical protein